MEARSPDGRLPMDQRVLIDALSLMPVGLHVVTACVGGKPAGLLCGWVTQASWDPPLIVIVIGRSMKCLAPAA